VMRLRHKSLVLGMTKETWLNSEEIKAQEPSFRYDQRKIVEW